jgi:WD40 repeat protein
VEALGRIIDQNSHVLKEDPSLFLQQVHNALVWDWDGSTPLGRRLATAVAQYGRPCWFRRLSRSAAVADPALLRMLTGHRDRATAATFAPDGHTLVTVDALGRVYVWDATTGELRKILDSEKQAQTVGVGSEGRYVVVGDAQWGWSWWDIATGARTGNARSMPRTLPAGGDNPLVWDKQAEGFSTDVRRVAVSHDAALLATALVNGTVVIWETATGKVRRTVPATSAGVTALCFAPDGNTLAIARGKNHLTVLELGGGEERPLKVTVDADLTAVALSPQGRMLATAGEDWRVLLWDLAAGVPRRIFTGPRREVNALAFAPDGQKLVTGGADKRVILWDLTTPRRRCHRPAPTRSPPRFFPRTARPWRA